MRINQSIEPTPAINPRLMGDHHRALILDLLRVRGRISRSEIAKELGLSPSVMTRSIRRLLEEGSVREVGEGTSEVGRRPVLLEFNTGFATTLGAHIRPDRVECALVDLDANVLSRSETVVDGPSDVSGIQEALARSLEAMRQENTVGIGIAISGLVDIDTGEAVYSPVLGWRHVPLRAPLEESIGLPVIVENDANVLALAESLYGSGRGYRDQVCLMVGDGIGSGIILNGALHRGALGAAGEIGHTAIEIGGPVCRCGESGCLEEYCANRALLRRANDLGLEGVSEMAAAARGGRADAREVFQTMGRTLGIAVKDAVNILSPEAVIVGGERMQHADLFFDEFASVVTEHAFPRGGKTPKVLPWQTGPEGLLLGAAGLVSKAFLQSPVSQKSLGFASSHALASAQLAISNSGRSERR